MRRSILVFLSAGLALAFTGCTTIHELGIPSAQFDAITVEQVEISLAGQEARLNVVMRFLVDNPTGTRFLIPRHDFALLLGLETQSEAEWTQVHASTQATTIVPAEGKVVIPYTIPLSLNPVAANRVFGYLGHDAVYQFQAAVDLGPLNPPSGPPTLKHRGRIRLPLPPRIDRVGVPSFEFVGGLARIDLTDIKEQMQPAVDAITAFGAGNIPLLGPKWQEFLVAFNRLNLDIRYPGPNTEGVRISTPLLVTNPNHFPIELPSFTTAARIVGTANPVLDVRLTPQTGTLQSQRRIDGQRSKRLDAVSTVRWKDLANGLPQILQPGGLGNVQLSGAVSVDLGYGPMRITYP